ncbi:MULTISPECIES: hypothetical protein [unclassified Haladaptatus]|uniref:hypothetical protein n=1 Tax=unclassified Haladaptatus TaxID=2622732 RepID=UPI0023E8E502|nr:MULTISPECIES: hypothetical protein [unclassified Haladaptatus]
MSEPPPLEWTIDGTSARTVRVLRTALAASIGAFAILFALLFAYALPAIFATLTTEVGVLVVILALVGGPASLLYLWPMLTDASQRPTLEQTVFSDIENWGQIAVLAVLLAACYLLVIRADSRAILAILIFKFGLLVAISLFAGVGSIDRERGVLRYGAATKLDALAGVRTVKIGDVVLCYLSYKRGAARLNSPRFVSVPADQSDQVALVLEAGVEQDGPERDEPDRLVQAVLLSFAAVFLGAAAFFWIVADGAPPGILLYVVLVTGLLGAAFALVAVFEA